VLGVRGSEFAIMWSEQSPEHAHDEAAAHPDMSDPAVQKGLSKVGETRVVMRRGRVR
jgi:hypothetical protein